MNTVLERHVESWYNQEVEDGYPEALKDLLEHGCQSGMIGHLIYTTDCVEFYRAHQRDIDALLNELCRDCGCRPDELFRDWDDEDPLAREDHNQTILAWFGFEETARRLADRIECEA